jgi:excisionase family DNA binding protein
MGEDKYPGDELLDISRAAEYLSKSDKTVRRYIKSGRIRARKVRNVWYCPRAELDKILASEAEDAEEGGKSVVSESGLLEEIKTTLETIRREKTPGMEPVAAPSKQSEKSDAVFDEIRETLAAIKRQNEEIGKRLYLLSRERESGIVRPDLLEKEQEIEDLKAEVRKLNDETSRLRAELSDAKAAGPKDTQLLKSKQEELETMRAVIASNERGLALLREDVERGVVALKERDAQIAELRERLRSMESELAARTAKKTGLWPVAD